MDPLIRIADALERIAPPRPRPVPADAAAHRWDGALQVADFAPLPLELLTGIDPARDAFVENARRHAAGLAAHDVLLWGARGSGKSALVKAGIGRLRSAGHDLALVEVASDDSASLPALFAQLHDWRRRVVVFIDDLGFDDTGAGARMLRSVLDGGASARPANVRLAVTSNRRHIVARDMAEQAAAISARDVLDDGLALADRFGLSLGFHVADQPAYLAIVEGYARAYDLPFDPVAAVRFATQRGSRSGRVAWHYIVELAGSRGRALDRA